MACVLFLLDAMRHDYIERDNTPFLWSCAQNGEYYKRVIPNLGFCERTEILTGRTPSESGYFTAIGYEPGNSPFVDKNYLFYLELMESFIPRNIRRYYRSLVNRMLRKNIGGMNPYSIPFTLLPYFTLTEDNMDHGSVEAFSKESILSLLTQAGGSYFCNSFTALNLASNATDKDRMKLALDAARSGKYDLYLIFVSIPDKYGHKYGPNSHELSVALKKMDHELKNFVNVFDNIIPDSQFVFLGDHGMVPVYESFDAGKYLLSIAKALGIKERRDFIYFLDSTFVRVWLFSDRARKLLPNALKTLDIFNEHGAFIDEQIACKQNIPWGDRRYGDLMWWANPGILVFPDFFHCSGAYKGMHGYDPELLESQGCCILYGGCTENKVVETIKLIEINQILRNNLSL